MSKTYGERVCPWCGEIFTATHPRQKVCKKEHFMPCPDCGRLVKIVETSYAEYLKHGPKRCRECSVKYRAEKQRNKSNANKEVISEKRKQTNLQKYGVEYPSQLQQIKNKTKQTNLERYGVEHPLQNDKILAEMQESNKQKYGCTNVSQVHEVQQKISQSVKQSYSSTVSKRNNTMLDKYGVVNPMQNESIKQKQQSTMLKSYGAKYPMQSEVIKQKTSESVFKKYGVEHISKSEDVKDRKRQTSLEHFGTENPAQNEEVKHKIAQTNLQRYGAVSPIQNESVKHKAIETNKKKYGSEYFSSSIVGISQKITEPDKLGLWLEFKIDPKQFILSRFDTKPTVSQLCQMLGVTDTPVYEILIQHNASELVEHTYSSMESQVYEFLKSLDSDMLIVRNDRTAIKPLELDLYLPDYNLAIECNPTITHNSSYRNPWGKAPLGYRYHADKSAKAAEAGIFLFHVFGYEWNARPEVIKSMLRNLIGKTTDKVYARNTYVCEVSDSVCRQFLDENHRQGATTSKIRLGLKTKGSDELVSVMTFSKIRKTMGDTDQSTAVWELSRFCNKLNTSVVGGASKLFKYFTEHFDGDIVSFSDKAHTTGKMYEVLGFHKVSESAPNYVWVNLKTDEYYNRVSCQKSKLPKLFKDPNLDIENSTERQIMESHGYVRVHDCGVIRWEWGKGCYEKF